MFNPKQYRDKADEYSERGKTANGPMKLTSLNSLKKASERSRTMSNGWPTITKKRCGRPALTPLLLKLWPNKKSVLRCLGAALILQWSSLTPKLQRELLDTDGAMGELLDTSTLRGQIARFLHKHKDSDDEIAEVTQSDAS